MFNFNEYQVLASRTMNKQMENIGVTSWEMHALHGMVGELGELHSIYQKVYQGHPFDEEHAIKEVGDLLWFIAEWCTSRGVDMEDVARINIRKLMDRYPDGFDAEHSLHRKPGDI